MEHIICTSLKLYEKIVDKTLTEHEKRLKIAMFNTSGEIYLNWTESENLRKLMQHRLSNKKSIYKSKYNITLEEHAKMVKEANGHCEICGREFGSRTPHIDHNHETGMARGLICATCNAALGMVKENIKTLESMAAYLIKHQERHNALKNKWDKI